MPLVVPGVTDSSSSKSTLEQWQLKLMGKKLGDSHSETTFAEKELPEHHRVVNEGSMLTMDHKPDRLNVHVDKHGTINKVTHG